MLNCGMKLAAGAGSAVGAKPTPVGYNRAYVRAGENPTLKAFLEAWRQGKNFVTCGPMIFLKVNDEHRPGDTIEFGSNGGEVEATVEVLWDQPIERVEIIINGEVVLKSVCPTIDSEALGSKASFPKASLTKGSWIVARCIGYDQTLSDEEMAAYREGDRAWPSRIVFAHTSPVYVSVDGQLARDPKSLAEARQTIDAFERFADKKVADEYRDDLFEAIAEARRRLQN
jgi:hypothetical protein